MPAHDVIRKFESTQRVTSETRRDPTVAWTVEQQQELHVYAARVAERVAKSFKKYTRRSGAGPANSRFEHWDPIAGDEILAKRVASTLTRFVLGDVPEDVQAALLSARLAGILKSNGGVRVLGCGGTIRRIVLKQAAKETQASAQLYCGKNQYGMQKDGTGRMYRHIQALLAVRGGGVRGH